VPINLVRLKPDTTTFQKPLQVSFDAYRVAPQGDRLLEPVDLRNVMAVLPGRSPRRIYVTAHYDSLARIETPPPGVEKTATGFCWNVTDNAAPGANDDGSGTALTIELARVFAQSGLDFDAMLEGVSFPCRPVVIKTLPALSAGTP